MTTIEKLEQLKLDVISGSIDQDGIEYGFNRIIEELEEVRICCQTLYSYTAKFRHRFEREKPNTNKQKI
jgi:hypothetical protein